jgi:hypothetical protein
MATETYKGFSNYVTWCAWHIIGDSCPIHSTEKYINEILNNPESIFDIVKNLLTNHYDDYRNVFIENGIENIKVNEVAQALYDDCHLSQETIEQEARYN